MSRLKQGSLVLATLSTSFISGSLFGLYTHNISPPAMLATFLKNIEGFELLYGILFAAIATVMLYQSFKAFQTPGQEAPKASSNTDSQGPDKNKENNIAESATKIQLAFKGFKARKTLNTLKTVKTVKTLNSHKGNIINKFKSRMFSIAYVQDLEFSVAGNTIEATLNSMSLGQKARPMTFRLNEFNPKNVSSMLDVFGIDETQSQDVSTPSTSPSKAGRASVSTPSTSPSKAEQTSVSTPSTSPSKAGRASASGNQKVSSPWKRDCVEQFFEQAGFKCTKGSKSPSPGQVRGGSEEVDSTEFNSRAPVLPLSASATPKPISQNTHRLAST